MYNVILHLAGPLFHSWGANGWGNIIFKLHTTKRGQNTANKISLGGGAKFFLYAPVDVRATFYTALAALKELLHKLMFKWVLHVTTVTL